MCRHVAHMYSNWLATLAAETLIKLEFVSIVLCLSASCYCGGKFTATDDMLNALYLSFSILISLSLSKILELH